jgi:hypothetical protein
MGFNTKQKRVYPEIAVAIGGKQKVVEHQVNATLPLPLLPMDRHDNVGNLEHRVRIFLESLVLACVTLMASMSGGCDDCDCESKSQTDRLIEFAKPNATTVCVSCAPLTTTSTAAWRPMSTIMPEMQALRCSMVGHP